MSKANKFSPEVRERSIRLVEEQLKDHPSQWAAITSIAGKIACAPETLRAWIRQAERDRGARGGPTSDKREQLKALQKEVRELRRTNEILKAASASFCEGGVRPPTEMMVEFIDQNRQTWGVEPICDALPIAPSTYHEVKVGEADPRRLSARRRRDIELRTQIQKVWDENLSTPISNFLLGVRTFSHLFGIHLLTVANTEAPFSRNSFFHRLIIVG